MALSLKTVGGFSVREIARAFLADEATIAQRLVRAKRQIREIRASASTCLRDKTWLHASTPALEVIYLMFNEGYAAQSGEDLVRHDLCGEALRLGRLLATSSVGTPQAHALVALMAFQAARLPARVDAAGELVLLEDQDRSQWDRSLIALGFHHFDDVRRRNRSYFLPRASCDCRNPRSRPGRTRNRLEADSRTVRPTNRTEPIAGGGTEPRGRRGQSQRTGSRTGRAAATGRQSLLAKLLLAPSGPRTAAARHRRQAGGIPMLPPGARASMLRTRNEDSCSASWPSARSRRSGIDRVARAPSPAVRLEMDTPVILSATPVPPFARVPSDVAARQLSIASQQSSTVQARPTHCHSEQSEESAFAAPETAGSST